MGRELSVAERIRDYRNRALEARKAALLAHDPEAKKSLQWIAAGWRQLAHRVAQMHHRDRRPSASER
jgi:hypothetical protein